jgi:hypothetical protein
MALKGCTLILNIHIARTVSSYLSVSLPKMIYDVCACVCVCVSFFTDFFISGHGDSVRVPIIAFLVLLKSDTHVNGLLEPTEYDFIIDGGGAAGCLLTAAV